MMTKFGVKRARDLKIGFDLDGVLFNTISHYIDACNRMTGTSYQIEDVHQYSLELMPGWSKPIVEAAIVSTIVGNHYSMVVGAETLIYYIRSHQAFDPYVHFITSRRKLFRRITEYRLSVILPPWALHSGHSGLRKYLMVAYLDLDYFVEDCLEEAEFIAERGTTLVFLMDAPYNRGVVNRGIVRVKSFYEIQEYLTDAEGEGYDYLP